MRSMRMAALALVMALACSGLALARDNDDDHRRSDKHNDRRQDWKHDRDHDRDHNRDRDHDRWRDDHDRDRGRWEREHRWWGRDDHRRDDGYYGGQIYNRYPRGYPGGNGYPGGGYGYPNGGYGNSGVYGRQGNGRDMGYNFGYQDGSYMARKDMSQNKPFNPNPRNEFGNRTRGYNSSFGDKNYYRSQYTSGYSAGYQQNYRGGRGWGY